MKRSLFCFLYANMNRIKGNWRLGLLILVGSLSWALTMVKSGLATKWGLGFWGANGHDGIWHLALIESIKHGFPINNPLFSGTTLTNYHWGFDLVVATVSRLTGVSVSLLYFQILPPVLAILIGVLSYFLVKKWTGSDSAAKWATFFTYFGGSFGWVVSLWRTREVGGESLFWAQQSISTLINPPFALSLVFLIGGFYLVLRDLRPRFFSLVLQMLIFGLLFIVKSYAGIIGLSGLVVIGFWQAARDKQFVGLVRAGVAVAITAFLVLLVVPRASGLLVFEPLWFPRTMVEAGDRLSIPKLAEALGAYFLFKMYARVAIIEILITGIFVVGNFGTRVLSFFYFLGLARKKAKVGSFDLALMAMFLVSVLFPLVFVQKGTAWNTIQFFYYGQIFAGWMAGVMVANLSLRSLTKKLFVLLVILITLPTSLSSLFYQYIPARPPAALPFNELTALSFLRQEPVGTVLVYPYEKPVPWEKLEPPVPLRRYDSTAYVSAYSGQPSYFADSVNLDILGISWKQRFEQAKDFFSGENSFLAMRFLKDNHISYIYLSESQELPSSERQLGVSMIYTRDGVKIYRVQGI